MRKCPVLTSLGQVNKATTRHIEAERGYLYGAVGAYEVSGSRGSESGSPGLTINTNTRNVLSQRFIVIDRGNTQVGDPSSVVCCLFIPFVVCLFESLPHEHAMMVHVPVGFRFSHLVCKNGLQSWRQVHRLCSSIDR